MRSSGGRSMCKIPAPAVIHCGAVGDEPTPPIESWCWNVPSIMYVTVSNPRGDATGFPWARRGRTPPHHLVHVHERVELRLRDAGEGSTDWETLALET